MPAHFAIGERAGRLAVFTDIGDLEQLGIGLVEPLFAQVDFQRADLGAEPDQVFLLDVLIAEQQHFIAQPQRLDLVESIRVHIARKLHAQHLQRRMSRPAA